MKTLQNFLEEQFNDGMMLAVLSGQRNKDKDTPTKVRIRPVEIKGEIYYQATATVGTKAVHKNYTADEVKDYIKNPKKSGYRSLHLIIEVPIFLRNEKKSMKVEVQLRTIAMDFWASLEHKLRYKKNIDPKENEMLEKDLVECSEISAALDKRMEEIRDRIEKKL